ncbi:universal stress protein [Aquabacterium sp. A7-Y]|uniref:universal stress protein n=1 Tax=Aquabacterium sp. A7-Y TaxID=1349605 RepID=UPI00223E57E0|nr:universal stress protein [Aquabacterium sp. A7-Y]MCW7540574.1 universal stress protein [Aquabacterium sp. A7-Y]
MSYRTILVHLDETPRCTLRVALAARLARRHESHLLGLAPTGAAEALRQVGGTFGAVEEAEWSRAALHARAQSTAHCFQAQAAACGTPSFEARLHEADVLASMLQHARNSDLLVIGQNDRASGEPAVPADFAQQLLLQSGRPVLIVPGRGEVQDVGERIVVAWNNSRESARAMSDALPLLARARSVHLLFVDAADNDAVAPTHELEASCEWLRRHGVAAEGRRVLSAAEAGRALLSGVEELGADLLVMGAYGHTRLREFILGGATRTLLSHMNVPVLMSR